jgi:hypothetical protein
VQEEPREVRRFHLWYMEAAKVGLETFIVKMSVEYFHLPDNSQLIVDFHDMPRLLQRKDLDVLK